MPSESSLFLGLDIGGTKSTVVVGTSTGNIIYRLQFPTNAQRGHCPIIQDLISFSQQMLHAYLNITAIGVSIGGPLDPERGIIYSPPNLPDWNAIPLKAILQERLHLPVHIEHDAAACALAEHRWGEGRGSSRLIYLTCGTGFGAGLVFDGKIYRGAQGQTVEIGHTRLRDDGPEAFGKRGSAESFCAAGALGKIAAWKFPQRFPEIPDSKHIADLAQSGDPDAQEILNINARAVGEVCANLCDLLGADVILLGSLATYLGAPWLTAVRARFAAEALAPNTCRIAPAGLGARLQDCSAIVPAVAAQI